ncbi:class I SAM-dependent methyltransferase [Streptomyces sp. DSM 41634]|uniref:class I SAM-dependent methyltransferase n=1 Tax=Streptomyces sp. DSM 41634 TaxID=3448656 RepID=UPI0040400CB1
MRDLIDFIAESESTDKLPKLGFSAGISSCVLQRYAAIVGSSCPPHSGQAPLLLDAGAGTGGISWWISRNAPCNAVAVDYAATACKLGAERFGGMPTSLRFVVGDLCRLPFLSQSFSAAISIDALYLLPDPDAGLAELARVLFPNAPLIFTLLCSTAQQAEVERSWISRLGRHQFGFLRSTDMTRRWRLEIRRRHSARWAKRHQILCQAGPAAAEELTVTRAILGIGGRVPLIDSTCRLELHAVRC